jgi:hypothetical protein
MRKIMPVCLLFLFYLGCENPDTVSKDTVDQLDNSSLSDAPSDGAESQDVVIPDALEIDLVLQNLDLIFDLGSTVIRIPVVRNANRVKVVFWIPARTIATVCPGGV